MILSGTSVVTNHAAVRTAIKEVIGSDTDAELKCVILTASDETRYARLKQREIGSALEEHLASSRRWAERLDAFDEVDVLRVSTDDASVVAVAEKVVACITKQK